MQHGRSNIGLYSLPMAQKAGPSGKVISIDANPSMAERLLVERAGFEYCKYFNAILRGW